MVSWPRDKRQWGEWVEKKRKWTVLRLVLWGEFLRAQGCKLWVTAAAFRVAMKGRGLPL